MNSEWVLAKELLGVGGLPGTIQGIHKRALKEGWDKTDIIQDGVRGRSIGYKISSLPEQVQLALSGEIIKPTDAHKQKPAQHKEEDRLQVFLDVLSEEEKDELAMVLARHGVALLLNLIDNDTPELLQLSPSRKKLALLSNHLTESEIKEILLHYEKGTKSQSIR
jgi:hypothetical protein